MIWPRGRRDGARVTNVRRVSDAAWSIPLSDVFVDDELRTAVDSAVASGWWSMGPRVAAFEERFADFTGVRHAIAVSSGTAALHLALLAADVGPGDEVLTPALTFVAVANAIHHTGATPVFCDVTGETDLNVDPEHVTASMTARTKAVVVLHYGGFPCAIEHIAEAACERGVALIEDAAHAIGARHRDRACGAIGALGCFSFFANKNLPVGEGGVVVTDDEDLARRVRLLRSHGMTTLTWDRHQGHASDYDVLAPGFNYRLDELRAALAAVQLDRLASGNAARGRLWSEYVRLLHGTQGLVLPFADRTDDLTTSAYHLAVAVLPEGTNRDAVRLQLAEDGIQTSVHYPPVHRFSAYAGSASPSLPQTDAIANRLLTLPLYPQLSSESVERVARAVRAALDARDAADRRVVSPAEL